MNDQNGDYRYVCSETYRDQNYDFSTPSYDDTNYYDDQSYDDNQYNDDYQDQACVDYDNDGYCDDK